MRIISREPALPVASPHRLHPSQEASNNRPRRAAESLQRGDRGTGWEDWGDSRQVAGEGRKGGQRGPATPGRPEGGGPQGGGPGLGYSGDFDDLGGAGGGYDEYDVFDAEDTAGREFDAFEDDFIGRGTAGAPSASGRASPAGGRGGAYRPGPAASGEGAAPASGADRFFDRIFAPWTSGDGGVPGDGARARREAGGGGGADGAGGADDAGGAGEWGPAAGAGDPSAAPGVVPLTRAEADLVLPLAPIGTQVKYYTGDLPANVQRVGASLAAAVVLSKFVLLAATAATYPLWAPWAEAGLRNLSVKKLPYAGLWDARVTALEGAAARPESFARASGGRARAGQVLRVTIGDASGAETAVEVPMRRAYARARVGDSALVLVVSDSKSMRRFRAVRDVYLPESGAWLADYPFVDRGAFLALVRQLRDEGAIGGGADASWE